MTSDKGHGEITFSPTEVTYIHVRTLGRGAFGEAVLYKRVEDNLLVVWKEIMISKISERDKIESDNEVEILALLDHPNIVTYYNHFIDDGVLLIEMEYANGDNLWVQIKEQKILIKEDKVVWYFYQLMDAVAYIHKYDIIHRDIKSLNIFLTKSGMCKLGDFGLSKVLGPASMAQSAVGTPYYMSPELIKGEGYNYKSDVWACGCVLFELLTLKRIFEADNALRLAAMIVQDEIRPISSSYSSDMQDLMKKIFQKDPSKRLSTEEVLEHPCLSKYADEITKKVWMLNSAVRYTRTNSVCSSGESHTNIVKSQSSEVYVWGGGMIMPRKLDLFEGTKSAAQAACSKNHYAVVTIEKELYTWTNTQGQSQMQGQLGHGAIASYKNPKKVKHFENVAIKQVACGDEFTACLTDDGILYTFGSDYYGSLGQPDIDQLLLPSPVPFFTETPVVQVSCGNNHVVALTRHGKVYSWGCGEFGRLGLGDEDDRMEPTLVTLPAHLQIRSVHAGTDCTFLITHSGCVMATGSNEHNKLGLMNRVRGIAKRKAKVCYDVPIVTTFKLVKPLRQHRIVEISSGTCHTAAITDFGQLLTFGINRFGQLGLGDFRQHPGINLVGGSIISYKVKAVSCGDNFTVISTEDNQIFSCGSFKDGRLGIAEINQNIAHPRPIFGALHSVGSINSVGWGTILVADKVISQKTIRQQSAGSTRSGSSADYQESASPRSEHSATSSQGSAAMSTMLATATPAWVKAEFDNASTDLRQHMPPPNIDLKLDLNFNQTAGSRNYRQISQSDPISPGRNVFDGEELNNNEPSISSTELDKLNNRIAELERENSKLKKKTSQQERVIDKLVKRLEKVDSNFRDFHQQSESQ